MKLLGYAAQNMTLGTGASKTCRLRNADSGRLGRLAARNLDDLQRIIAWNIEERIFLYRISSNLIPYASHPVNKLNWAKQFKNKFAEIGGLIQESGMSVSMHPGQYTVLSSPAPEIAARALTEIEYHHRVLDLLRTGPEAKINIHLGGKYNDKDAAMIRWERNFRRLSSDARGRLTIENDGVNYDVQDCLRMHSATGVPVVFDTHHFDILEKDPKLKIPAMEKALATWGPEPVKPEIHFATQDPDKKRPAHSPTIDPEEFADFYRATENLDFNIMLETKDKELSLLKIRERFPDMVS